MIYQAFVDMFHTSVHIIILEKYEIILFLINYNFLKEQSKLHA